MATVATLTDGSRDCPEGRKASVSAAGEVGNVVGVGGRCPRWNDELTPDDQYRRPDGLKLEGSREGNHRLDTAVGVGGTWIRRGREHRL